MVQVKCNQHPWMKAYVGVLKHPYFAVSAENGSFTIANVPPGTYTVVAWHEGPGKGTEKTMQVTVPAKGSGQPISVSAPARTSLDSRAQCRCWLSKFRSCGTESK